ncbi:hypothetical protein HDU82_001705 [Entophlyctis luteolus]|nr:hypothetical protein HDU82_001705 [Entophlyctis luteolus]
MSLADGLLALGNRQMIVAAKLLHSAVTSEGPKFRLIALIKYANCFVEVPSVSDDDFEIRRRDICDTGLLYSICMDENEDFPRRIVAADTLAFVRYYDNCPSESAQFFQLVEALTNSMTHNLDLKLTTDASVYSKRLIEYEEQSAFDFKMEYFGRMQSNVELVIHVARAKRSEISTTMVHLSTQFLESLSRSGRMNALSSILKLFCSRDPLCCVDGLTSGYIRFLKTVEHNESYEPSTRIIASCARGMLYLHQMDYPRAAHSFLKCCQAQDNGDSALVEVLEIAKAILEYLNNPEQGRAHLLRMMTDGRVYFVNELHRPPCPDRVTLDCRTSCCADCGTPWFLTAKLRPCMRCRSFYYCKQECYISSWPSHSQVCRGLRQLHANDTVLVHGLANSTHWNGVVRTIKKSVGDGVWEVADSTGNCMLLKTENLSRLFCLDP